MLRIPQSVFGNIRAWAQAAYPNEGCGLLIGRFGTNGQKDVIRLASLTNELLTKEIGNAPTLPQNRQGPGAGKTEFVMNPAEFNAEVLAAEKQGMDVVGIIHTHPDHPPRPSQIDASQPFLSQWSNVIVAVEKGQFKGMKSWFRDEETVPFSEEPIKVVDL